MSISDSKRKADRKWREKAYDKICLQYPKGTRETWKSEAKKRGLSLAQLIANAVSEFLSNHKGG